MLKLLTLSEDQPAWPTARQTPASAEDAAPNLMPVSYTHLTLFSTSSSFFLLQYATLRLPSAKVMAYSYLTPAWVMLWEIGFGSVLPPAPVLLGIGATVIALLMMLRNET